MASDNVRQRIVLFGGYSAEEEYPVGDTWEWDGSDWTERAVPGPGPRHGAVMAYDENRRRMVLFGGSVDRYSQVIRNDTWEWDGMTWTQRNPPPPLPLAQLGSAMAYDAARRRVVLHNNRSLWEWDGSAWVTRASAPAMIQHTLVFDASRQRLVALAGRDSNYFSNGRAWEWDGTSWVQGGTALSDRAEHASVYDPVRRRIVTFGGGSHSSTSGLQRTSGETLLYGAVLPAAIEYIGAGCAGASGIPHLAPSGRPVLGRPFFGLDVVNAHPSALVILPIAAASADIPFAGGCRMRIDPTTLLAAPYAASSAAGFATLRLPLPDDVTLTGLELYTQGIIPEPGQFVFTRGLRLTFGD
jgi:hypothetical protein